MRVLYVEDDRDLADSIVRSIEDIAGVSISIVGSLSSAIEAVEGRDFDFVLLDLAIPRADGGTPEISIGVELFREVEQRLPGCPVWIFTGQSSEQETHGLRDEVPRWIEYCGGIRRPYLSVKKKNQTLEVLQLVRTLADDRTAAADVVLSDPSFGALGDGCSALDRLILKGFCRVRNGARGRVAVLKGGLSGSRVYRLDVLSDQGVTRQFAVVKIDEGKSVQKELDNYRREVTRLVVGAPSLSDHDVIAGGRDRAIFYGLARDYDRTWFDSLANVEPVLGKLKECLSTWHDEITVETRTLEDVIVEISGAKGLALLKQACSEGEHIKFDLRIRFRTSVQHGDLHGENILVRSQDSDVCLIDFADVRRTIALLDPVTLELSPLFHPKFSERVLASCGGAQRIAQDWFGSDGPSETPWVSLTRAWMRTYMLSHVDFAAAVLAYCARQLKYADTNKELAMALARAAIAQMGDR